MMDEYKDKRYIKEIIKEYNILLESWGSSESWDLNQFKTLENMIFETTKIDVNANTLKRFFQQKRLPIFRQKTLLKKRRNIQMTQTKKQIVPS